MVTDHPDIPAIIFNLGRVPVKVDFSAGIFMYIADFKFKDDREIDNRLINIKGAKNTGLHAVLFRPVERLISDLQRLGLV